MASADKSTSEQDYLADLGHKVGELHAEAKRLNRRLRNARAAIQSIEDELGALAEQIEKRVAQLLSNSPRLLLRLLTGFAGRPTPQPWRPAAPKIQRATGASELNAAPREQRLSRARRPEGCFTLRFLW